MNLTFSQVWIEPYPIKKGIWVEDCSIHDKAKATAILDSMPPYVIINIQATIPLVPSDKIKLGETKAMETTDTVTGHHFNSIPNTLDILNECEKF